VSRLLIDPAMPTGPKFAGASDTAKLLHFLGLCYAAHAVSDGFVPEAVARKLTSASHKQFDQAIAHLTSVQPGCENPSWETRAGGWFLHDYDDPLYGNPMKEDSEKRREQKVKAGAAGGKKSAQARLARYGTAQPPSSKPEAEPEAPASKHPEAPASTSASTTPLPKQTEAPRSTTPPRVGARAHARNAHAEALPFPSSPDPSVTPDTSGVKETSLRHGDDAVLVGVPPLATTGNGASTSLTTQAIHLVDWLLVNRGDHTFGSKEEQQRELATASQMLQLGLSYPEVLTKLKAYRDAMDPDDVASSLGFYYGRLQDDAHAELKRPRAHASSGTTSKLGESLPDIHSPKAGTS
jgi:hypothetical protein